MASQLVDLALPEYRVDAPEPFFFLQNYAGLVDLFAAESTMKDAMIADLFATQLNFNLYTFFGCQGCIIVLLCLFTLIQVRQKQ